MRIFLVTNGWNRAGDLTSVKNGQIAAQQFEYKSQICYSYFIASYRTYLKTARKLEELAYLKCLRDVSWISDTHGLFREKTSYQFSAVPSAGASNVL